LFKKGTFDPASLRPGNFKITDSHYGALWTFFKCRDCSFVFSNPYIPDSAAVEFYSRLEDREYGAEAEGRSRNFKTILDRLKRLHPGNTLLDIGAASGIFVHLARGYGYEASGIEPSVFLAGEAREKYNISLFQGTVDEFCKERPGERFSVVTLLDIIEHLVEPGAFMERVEELLEDNGLLVIVTPDIGSLAARVTGRRWWHFRIAHVNFFDRRSLARLLEKHGFEIASKKKYVWNFSLFYLVTRIFPSLKRGKALQNLLKGLHLKLPLFDSWEIYARKTKTRTKSDTGTR
jgi:2-polyprenyl-3-methyl-5-hydroxy-6-metoxy-1,4-benzoquinol methylase